MVRQLAPMIPFAFKDRYEPWLLDKDSRAAPAWSKAKDLPVINRN